MRSAVLAGVLFGLVVGVAVAVAMSRYAVTRARLEAGPATPPIYDAPELV